MDDGATSEGAARVTRSHLASPARLPRRFTRRSTCFRVSFLGVSRSESFLNFCGTVCPPTAWNLSAVVSSFSAFSHAFLGSPALRVHGKPRIRHSSAAPAPGPRRGQALAMTSPVVLAEATKTDVDSAPVSEVRRDPRNGADPGSPRRRRREPSRPPPHLPPQRPRRAVRARRGPKRGSSLLRVRAERPTETRAARNGTKHRLTSCPAAPLRIPRTRIIFH